MSRVVRGLWGIFLLATLGLGPRSARADGAAAFLFAFGSAGSGNGQFNAPTGVAVSPNRAILVADALNHRIQVFDPAGKFLSAFGSQGSGSGQFRVPNDVAVSPDGTI